MGASRPIPPTRTEARAELVARGVQGRELEEALDAGAVERHRARVSRFVEEALDEVRRSRLVPVRRVREGAALAIAVLVLEAFGVVDRRVGPTEATARRHHRAFRENCGARTGPKAGATHAACRGAVDTLWRTALEREEGDPGVISLYPAGDDPGVVVDVAGLPAVELHVGDTLKARAQPSGWLLTIALEGHRRAFGLAPWFELGADRRPAAHEVTPTPHVLDLVRFYGAAPAWGRVIDAIDARRARALHGA